MVKMVDKDELLFFRKEDIEKMTKRAEELVKEHKLLYQYKFTIKTPMRITGRMIKTMTKNLGHYLTGYGAEISSREFLVGDDRELPKAPEVCKGCKWLRNGECWYNEDYYGTDFPIECIRHEKKE